MEGDEAHGRTPAVRARRAERSLHHERALSTLWREPPHRLQMAGALRHRRAARAGGSEPCAAPLPAQDRRRDGGPPRQGARDAPLLGRAEVAPRAGRTTPAHFTTGPRRARWRICSRAAGSCSAAGAAARRAILAWCVRPQRRRPTSGPLTSRASFARAIIGTATR